MTSRYRYRCCSTQAINPASVPQYIPKCCPTPPNTDPRRFEVYCPPVVSRSEPLSHSEYLRRLKANNGKALSSPDCLVQYGEGVYKKTIWTETADGGRCCNGDGGTLPAVPAVHQGGTALDAGLLTESRGAYAARGSVSVYDQTNRTEDVTTLRRQGLAISGDDSFDAPAGATRTVCTTCGFSGTTTAVNPGNPTCNCS